MKKMKKFLVLFCCLAMCLLVVGCQGSSGSSKKNVKFNLLTSEIKLTKVTYYDFYNEKKVSNYSGNWDSVISESLNSTEIWFLDKDGETRAICTNKVLSSKPDSIRVYTNASKSKYDTYSCEY